MKKHLLVLQLMGRWWRMEVGIGLCYTAPMKAGADIPFRLMQLCNVVYDVTTETMIKNRNGPDRKLDDAIVLRMWLDDDLPVFEYKGHKKLNKDFNEWCATIAA